jgi:hypothetical protein
VRRRATIELIVIPDSGTGISDRSVELLQFDGSKILKLWTHVSDDKWAGPIRLRNGNDGDGTGEESYQWRYTGGGTKIIVHGKETETDTPAGAGPSSIRATSKSEVFCLRGRAFVLCQ